MTSISPGRTILTAFALSATLFAGVAGAAQDDKILLCHGTASEPNPYVLISVDASALAGHFDGTAPGHGPRNNPDVYPVNGECPGGGGDE